MPTTLFVDPDLTGTVDLSALLLRCVWFPVIPGQVRAQSLRGGDTHPVRLQPWPARSIVLPGRTSENQTTMTATKRPVPRKSMYLRTVAAVSFTFSCALLLHPSTPSVESARAGVHPAQA